MVILSPIDDNFGVRMTHMQTRMARAALDWTVRDLAAKAQVSPNSVTRLERGEDVAMPTQAMIQRAFEEAGIEFLMNGGVRHHPDVTQAVITADPSMPSGVRRMYP